MNHLISPSLVPVQILLLLELFPLYQVLDSVVDSVLGVSRGVRTRYLDPVDRTTRGETVPGTVEDVTGVEA